MARSLEASLAEIAGLRDDPATDAARSRLRAALRSSTGVLVAAAVAVVRDHELEEHYDELAPAFERLLERPLRRDPGCRGKVAIARALHDLDRWEDGVFPIGVRHVQPEPVWGGREDTAAELRGVCGYAYAHHGHPDALRVLAELLADVERVAREAAARALADAGRVDADALLRFKILQGDPEPNVLDACFASLLAIDAEASLEFVRRFLDGDAATAEAAVLALGESRLEAAYPILTAWCADAMTDDAQRVGYLALALLRRDAATQTLLDTIRSAAPARALHSIRALAPFSHDAELATRVRAAAADRETAVEAAARDRFPLASD